MTEELEQITEEEAAEPVKMRTAWCTLTVGSMETGFDKEVPAFGEGQWDLRQLLADAVGIPVGMVRLDDVSTIYVDGWARPQFRVRWHVMNAKIGHFSTVKFV